MASKRAQRRKACTGKRRYETEADARRGIAILRRHGETALLTAYRCPHCHAFHFGHPPARVRQAIADRRSHAD